MLANEEVTAEGRSERGNHPVYQRPLKQWKLRITAYAERLLADLDLLDWPESIKLMQRNWIGRSVGADVVFAVENHEDVGIRVFTTRPDTCSARRTWCSRPSTRSSTRSSPPSGPTFGDRRLPRGGRPSATTGSRPRPCARTASSRRGRRELERQAEGKQKTGVFTGAFAINPVNDERIPIFVADYVLMGYGTGAIMAVPGQDQRDWEFAEEFDLPIVRTVQPPDGFDGAGVPRRRPRDPQRLPRRPRCGHRQDQDHRVARGATSRGEGAVTYKLRDWLFSRQRYWGEPFPIVYDDDGMPVAVPESMLPVELPEIVDFEPEIVADDVESVARAAAGAGRRSGSSVELDLRRRAAGRTCRETNTMPQWAGSCWYYLRYLDPTNEDRARRPRGRAVLDARSKPSGGVDLYVGGVEHAVLHLLYARFWHKVLFDLGHVSTPEPFHGSSTRAHHRGRVHATTAACTSTPPAIEERDGRLLLTTASRSQRAWGKMGKSRKNAVAPDDIYRDYGADTLRLYEMFMGPLDASRPWSTTDIVGVHRFLQRFWRNVIDEDTGELRVATAHRRRRDAAHAAPHDRRRRATTWASLQFNTAIARLFELNNRLTQVVAEQGSAPAEVVVPMVLMLAPLAPHIAEELWERLGHAGVARVRRRSPSADPAWLVEDDRRDPGPGQRQGAGAGDGPGRARRRRARGGCPRRRAASPRCSRARRCARSIVVPGRLVNFVVG